MSNENSSVPGLHEATDEGKHSAQSYRLEVGDESLDFKSYRIADPVPLGRQILAAAGVESNDEYSLFAVLPNGDFEDVRLDEAFDLRARGVERFIYFRTDRIFKFAVENRQLF